MNRYQRTVPTQLSPVRTMTPTVIPRCLHSLFCLVSVNRYQRTVPTQPSPVRTMKPTVIPRCLHRLFLSSFSEPVPENSTNTAEPGTDYETHCDTQVLTQFVFCLVSVNRYRRTVPTQPSPVRTMTPTVIPRCLHILFLSSFSEPVPENSTNTAEPDTDYDTNCDTQVLTQFVFV